MTRFAERDIYLTGVNISGLPTCVFPPASYARVITSILVGNSVPSGVKCYRGLLGSTPVASNLLGSDNTLSGELKLPSGQAFYVQWDAMGLSPSEAFARVSSERDDDPLEGGGSSSGQTWSSTAISRLVLPSNATGPPWIILDGSQAEIQIVAANGAEIDIDATSLYPHINFLSPDHTNQAGLSIATGGVSGADFIMTSGQYVPADTIPRSGRLWFDGAGDNNIFQVIRSSNQHSLGGTLSVRSADMIVGYRDFDGGIYHYLQAYAAGFTFSSPTTVVVPVGSTLAVTGTLAASGPVTIGGVSIGRGTADFVSSLAALGAIGAETVVLTGNAFTWQANRAYKVTYHQNCTPAGGATLALYNIRRTNLAGAVLASESHPVTVAAVQTCQASAIIRNALGVSFAQNIVLTLTAFPAGTITPNGGAANMRWLEVVDIGPDTAYPNAVQI